MGSVGACTRRILACALIASALWPARGSAAQGVPDALAAAARTVLPAVVTITVPGNPQDLGLSGESDQTGNLLLGMFGDGRAEGRREAVASGVILDASGLVVTAAHAVGESADIEAITADGARHTVTVVGVDRKSNLAALRLGGPGPFAHAAFGDSAEVRVGAWVLAIGSPFGLGTTVTAGIVSATPRPRPAAAVDELLQTDATAFPDSVGGPLVNARAEVIGLITVLTAHDFGISFALPSNAVRKVVARLARDGVVERGVLDARLQRLTPGLARALASPEPTGLLVAEVSPRGAVAGAGLRRGDVVIGLDGAGVATPYDLDRALRDSAPGQVVEVAYWRRGQQRTVRVPLARDAEEQPARPFASRQAAMLGFEVRPITPEAGVVISHVRPVRPATEPGVRAGDVIREVNERAVRTVAEFDRLVEAVRPGEWLALLVQRGRAAVYVAVEARGH